MVTKEEVEKAKAFYDVTKAYTLDAIKAAKAAATAAAAASDAVYAIDAVSDAAWVDYQKLKREYEENESN